MNEIKLFMSRIFSSPPKHCIMYEHAVFSSLYPMFYRFFPLLLRNLLFRPLLPLSLLSLSPSNFTSRSLQSSLLLLIFLHLSHFSSLPLSLSPSNFHLPFCLKVSFHVPPPLLFDVLQLRFRCGASFVYVYIFLRERIKILRRRRYEYRRSGWRPSSLNYLSTYSILQRKRWVA